MARAMTGRAALRDTDTDYIPRVLGQYFTGAEVAEVVLGLGIEREDDRVLDPSCGEGVFLERARELVGPDNLWGVELDPRCARRARERLGRAGARVMVRDFFDLVPEDFPKRFDLIVGNPPYTRQEKIPAIASADRSYKDGLIASALAGREGGPAAKFSRRAGLHTYFFAHAYKFLNEGGRIAFVVSSAWLDAGYGHGLQKFILERFQILCVIESRVERWFADADVNTGIVVLRKCSDPAARGEHAARFVSLQAPLSRFSAPAGGLINTLMTTGKRHENEPFRVYSIKQKELEAAGCDPAGGQYLGSKWGHYLRAPEIYFTILSRNRGIIAPLSKFAQTASGFKTGADPWFMVTDLTRSLPAGELRRMARDRNFRGALSDLAYIESGDGSRWLVERKYLAPVLRGPAAYRRIGIAADAITDWAVAIKGPRERLAGTMIEEYIRHGEQSAYRMGKGRSPRPAETLTCRARERWYQLPGLRPATLFWQKAFDVTHRHYLAEAPVLANQRFYPVYPFNPAHTAVLAAYFNSTLTALYLEFQRAALGLGAIEATVEEVARLPTIDPDAIAPAARRRIVAQLKKMSRRMIGTIFEELGAGSGGEVSLASVRPDRRELDRLFWEGALGLTEAEQADIYRAAARLARERIARAESLRAPR